MEVTEEVVMEYFYSFLLLEAQRATMSICLSVLSGSWCWVVVLNQIIQNLFILILARMFACPIVCIREIFNDKL